MVKFKTNCQRVWCPHKEGGEPEEERVVEKTKQKELQEGVLGLSTGPLTENPPQAAQMHAG